jgi:hypothetical protein
MELTIGWVVVGTLALLGFSLGFLSGAGYALRSVRIAIEGSKRVRK